MEAGMSGTVASETTRQLWATQRLAMWADPVLRERIVTAMRERAADPEHQKRRGKGIAAWRNTPEAKAAVSAHMLDLWANPEHRQTQSQRRKANWQDDAYRSQQSESRKATWQDPDVQARHSAGQQAAWQDPQKRANRVAGLKAAWVRRKARTAEP